MEGNKEEYYSLSDISDIIKLFFRYLRKKWWLLLLAALVGGVLGALYYSRQKPRYQAESTFILEEKSSGGGGLAGLASQFGFDLGGMSGGSIFAGDNILNILTSKKVVHKVLLSAVTDTVKPGQTLADLYLDFTGIKKSWAKNSALADMHFSNAKNTLTPLQDSVLNVIYETVKKNHIVTERISKQGTIIRVQVTALNRMFARLMTERLVAEASKLYLDIRVGTAQENIRQMQRRSDSLLYLLNNKSYRAAASQPLDINPGIRTAIVPVEIATRDKSVLATLYAEVIKNLEASKMLLSQQTPVVQLLDGPGYLLKDNKKGLLFLVIFAALAAMFLSLLVVVILFIANGMKNKPAIPATSIA